MAKKKGNFASMNKDELTKKLADFRGDLQTLHFKAEGARSKNVKEVKNLKREIARVLTVMNQK